MLGGDVHNPHQSKLQGGVGNSTRTREAAVRTGAGRGEHGHSMVRNTRGLWTWLGQGEALHGVSDVKPSCPFSQHTQGCLPCVFRAVVRRDAARTVIYGRSIADEMEPPRYIHWVNVTRQ